MSTYLWIDLGALVVPLLFSFHPRLRFHHTWHALWPGLALMMLFFIPWDVAFTRLGIWGFNPAHLIGIPLAGLPVEEWLFFFCIPYACVFTHHAFRVLGVKDHFNRAATWITGTLFVSSTLLVLLFHDRAYTASAFGGLAGWLLLLLITKPAWTGRAYFSYLVLLLPFLVVNGLLTGSLLDEPVVWYDDAENLGLRIATIPVEDVFYGLFMFLVVLTVYEAVLGRKDARGSRAQ